MLAALVWSGVLCLWASGDPVTSLSADGARVLVNGAPTFLVGQMSAKAEQGRSLAELQQIVDVMMLPCGMNLWIGSLGEIDYSAWNSLVNHQRGTEPEPEPLEYPWRRTGDGDTLFGGPRFDLDDWNVGYFATLRARVDLLNASGIVPVVGLFSEHAIDHPLHWRGHPFHPANNVNPLGLPEDDAIPEFFTSPPCLRTQEAYVRRVLATLSGAHYILSPFGEVNAAPDAYLTRWLALFHDWRESTGDEFLVCLSGPREVLDRIAAHPAVDLVDAYCYHDGVYDAPEVNAPDGPLGLTATIREVRERYGKPAGRLYFKYGYPYADATSPWADPATGTDGGGPPEAASDALRAVYEAGGFALFLKMAWRRDRGAYLQPDRWSADIRDFVESIEGVR